jgi:diphthamide synthase (EF-2-diphthine--ammonia ligase)
MHRNRQSDPRETDRPKTLLSWSSGKDSAWALHVAQQQRQVKVVGLLTTVNEHFARIAMHSVREEVLEAQARAVGLPLWRVLIPHPCPNEVYEDKMRETVERDGFFFTHVSLRKG